MAGGDDEYIIPTHNLDPHSQEQYGYGVDGWRHSPAQQHQVPSPGFVGQSTYGKAQDLSPAAGTPVARPNVPGMFAPGPRPAPQSTQRQSAELGF
ncbi:hypothetical protein KEM56_002444 [Ascosphaera pollenicola]|nr:hypothetical protein KEM56_002444 [Ascosphaera pollenicola]